MLNGDALAFLKWSTDNAFVFPEGKVGEAAARAVRGQKRRNARTGDWFVPLTDSQALTEIEPKMDRAMIRAKRLPQAVANLRNLPLEQLKLIFGPTLWRCTYCHRFFEAKDLRKRRYCSSPRRCGKDMEARKAVAQMRDAVDNEKLRRVRGALELCPPSGDRKAWIAQKAGVSKNWITYAVARGEIKL